MSSEKIQPGMLVRLTESGIRYHASSTDNYIVGLVLGDWGYYKMHGTRDIRVINANNGELTKPSRRIPVYFDTSEDILAVMNQVKFAMKQGKVDLPFPREWIFNQIRYCHEGELEVQKRNLFPNKHRRGKPHKMRIKEVPYGEG